MLELKWQKNVILEKLEQAQSEKRKIYIYGCGELGRIVERALTDCHISFEAFCVDEVFYEEGQKVAGRAVNRVEQIIEESTPDNRTVLVVAFWDYDDKRMEKFKDKVELIHQDVFCFHTVDGRRNAWSKAFFEAHMPELTETYQQLSDEKSRECMRGFLYQKMTGDFKYLREIYEPNQYYDSGIVDFGKIHSFVDCGAYDGDSFLAFAENYRKHTGKIYRGGYIC